MKAQLVSENLEFNFKGNPTDRFRGGLKGPSYPPTENPRKKRDGLNPEEQEIVDRHQEKIDDIRDEIWDKESEEEDLEGELFNLKQHENPDTDGLEQFYADIQNQWGEDTLDLLNSGASLKEKETGLDKAMGAGGDLGPRAAEMLMGTWAYYHPDPPDPEEIKKVEDQLEKIRQWKEEKQNTIDNLETKIYNLETY